MPDFEKRMEVSILGSTWIIEDRTRQQDVSLKNISGYCDPSVRLIVVLPPEGYDGELAMKDLSRCYRSAKRHEIIHAYFWECGLWDNSHAVDAWAVNEEMVDWLAIQWPKIHSTFADAGCEE